MLKEGRIGNEKEDCLEDLAKSDDFDIYALIDFNGMNYVFGCLQAKQVLGIVWEGTGIFLFL